MEAIILTVVFIHLTCSLFIYVRLWTVLDRIDEGTARNLRDINNTLRLLIETLDNFKTYQIRYWTKGGGRI